MTKLLSLTILAALTLSACMAVDPEPDPWGSADACMRGCTLDCTGDKHCIDHCAAECAGEPDAPPAH